MLNNYCKSTWCLAFVLFTGCGGYAEISERAYEYSQALYSISNRRAEDQLGALSERITADKSSGLLNERESRWLIAIVEDCRAGDWKIAQRDARRMMQDQTR